MLVKSVASRFFIVAIVAIVTIATIGVMAVVLAVVEPRHREPGEVIQRRAVPAGIALLCIVVPCYFTSWPWRKVLAMMGVV